MKHYSKRLLAVLCTAALASSMLGGCVFLPDEEEVLAAPSVQSAEISYTTVEAKRKDIRKVDINTATVKSQNEYNMAFSEQSGTIAKIHVRAGDKVKKGDLLCELDISSLEYSITETELYLKKAKLDKKVLEERGASQTEIDRAQVEVDLIQMQMDDLYAKRDDAKLYAEADGTVASFGSGISAGNYVDKGQTVMTIIDTDDLYISIVPDDFKLYDMGTPLFIEIGDAQYAAEVFMIPEEVVANGSVEEDKEPNYDIFDPDAEKEEAATGVVFDTEHVYIKFTDAPPEDCVGNLVDAVLVIDSRENVIAISNNLIKNIDGKNIVYLLKDGKKVAQDVEIGLKTASQCEITSGLSEGDIIIIR